MTEVLDYDLDLEILIGVLDTFSCISSTINILILGNIFSILCKD